MSDAGGLTFDQAHPDELATVLRILDWASTRAADDGKRWLRLDVHRRNPALQRYYERHGFQRVGTLVRVVQANDGGQPFTRNSGALYQRAAGTVTFPEQDRQADN